MRILLAAFPLISVRAVVLTSLPLCWPCRWPSPSAPSSAWLFLFLFAALLQVFLIAFSLLLLPFLAFLFQQNNLWYCSLLSFLLLVLPLSQTPVVLHNSPVFPVLFRSFARQEKADSVSQGFFVLSWTMVLFSLSLLLSKVPACILYQSNQSRNIVWLVNLYMYVEKASG